MATTNQAADAVLDDAEYRFLERRAHPWRKQLYLKGRNTTVAQVVYSIRTEGLTLEAAARDFDVPLEQIREAMRYYETHRDLVERDQEEERRRLEERGRAVERPATS